MKKLIYRAFTLVLMMSLIFPGLAWSEEEPGLPIIGGTVEITGEAKYGNTLELNITELYYTPDTPETGLDMPTCQWKRDAEDIAGAEGSTYELTADDIGKTISVTVTADGVHATGSFTGSLTDIVAKADGPAAPEAPTLASNTDRTITLIEIEGAEYKIDDSSWQDSLEFTGLEPETAYEFQARIKETATHLASAASEAASISTGEEVFASGNGSADSPYQIATAEQLAALTQEVYLDKYFILIDDIDLMAYLSEGGDGWNDGAGWLPVGTSGAPFTGSFDGGGHSIENLFIDRPGTNYIGLFGYIGSGADISNVDLVAVDVTGASSVGGLAGYNNGGAITACSAAGEVVGNMIDFLVGSHVGALVGYNKSGTVEACSAGGSVEGAQSVGGLVGYNTGGSTITGSWAAADVTGSGSNVGGLAGYNDGSTITGSWASGTVTGSGANSKVGGLVGINKNNSAIEKSWASGTVTGSGGGSNIGGLAGENWFYGTINQSWATGNVEGSGGWTNTGGLVGYNNDGSLSAIISDSYATGNVKNFGTSNTGGLVGYNYGTKSVISGSYASGGVLGTDNDSKVGGLVGYNTGVITESQALGSVTGSGNESSVGGLVGRSGWSIEKSKASGSVVGIGSEIQVGGLVGYNQHTIYNSYAAGAVTENGTDGTGGLVGVDDGAIRYSYSIGTVMGSGTIGGLVGKSIFTPVSASFWDTQASGQSDSDGGTGKTTAEMKTYATFYNAGWDFIDETANGANSIWGIDESPTNPDNNGYPFLAWEGFDHKVRPAVTTGEEVIDLAATTAVVQGEITCLGYPHAAQHGVCWSTEEDPTVDDAKTQEGEVLAEGAFTSSLTGLEEETTYYVKAYVINELGTYYGEQVQFTTNALAVVDIADIPGVTTPAAGQIPVTSITETDQYTGSVSWNPHHDTFQNATVYTATITLSAKEGYTLEGVTTDFFTLAGADTINNEADSGVVTAVFPVTEYAQYITVTATSPATGAAGVSRTPAIAVTFSESIEADSGYAGIQMEDAAANDVSISKSINSNVLTITPDNSLSYSATYTVTIPANAVKSAVTEANLEEEYLFNFTIQSAPVSGGGGGGGGTSAPPPVKDETETSKEISAAAGGTISLGDVSVAIPAGILPNKATFSIKKMNPGEANNIVPEGLRLKLGSDVYEIATTGERDFGDNSITIKIPYNKDKIASGEVPVINYYNEHTGKWTVLESTVEQGSDGKWYAVVKVNHLTKFAVFSTAAQSPVQPLKVIKLITGSIAAVIDGEPYALDAPPFVKPEVSRTLVPLRFVSEALGAGVEWRGESQEVVIRETRNGEQIEIFLTINSNQALVNNAPVSLDCAAQLHPPGRTFVPLRFVSETLGAQVEWEASGNTITITR